MRRFFKFEERNTNFKTETIAGITTFLAMAYILVVNPITLSQTGMDKGAVFTATALSAALGTLIMALFANYPIAQAPGMGMNAFFTYTVCMEMGLPWEVALAGIFVSGLIFIVISVTGLRKMIIDSIPLALKYAVGTGIGFFIAFIGFKNAGIIIGNKDTFVTLGNLKDPNTLLAIFGLVVTILLFVRNVKGAIFIGIISTTILGLFMGQIDLPNSIVQGIPSLEPTFGKVFDALIDSSTYTLNFMIVVFTFLFVDFFDTAGTLMAVGTRAGLINKETGELEDSERVLVSDAISTTIGAVIGTSSVTTYVESMTGVEEGGRTGFTSLVTAGLFLLAMFFFPLLGMVTSATTAPALIMVGALMVQSFGNIDWDDLSSTIPSFITVIMMVLTFSVAEGIALGFITYTIIKIGKGQRKDVSLIMYILTILFVAYFIFVK